MTGAMTGPERGLIPRSVEQLLFQSRELQRLGWKIAAQVSILEIYNEDVRDLLAGYPNASSASAGNGGGKIKIYKHAQSNRVLLSGVATFELPSASLGEQEQSAGTQVFEKLFDYAVQSRSTANTGTSLPPFGVLHHVPTLAAA
jgi:hypothetical protein